MSKDGIRFVLNKGAALLFNNRLWSVIMGMDAKLYTGNENGFESIIYKNWDAFERYIEKKHINLSDFKIIETLDD